MRHEIFLLFITPTQIIWFDQGCGNLKWLKLAPKQKLKDQYIQHWHMKLSNVSTSSGNNYRLFKTTFECGQYFKLLPLQHFAQEITDYLSKLATGQEINLHERTCTFCNNDIGDEYHYLLVCKNIRRTSHTTSKTLLL